jgi:thiol-disulfide isomerase/thioredoxin
MDRLPALILAVLVACNTDKAEPPASRVDNAKVSGKQIATVEAFCDYLAKDDASGPAIVWPQLAAGETAPPAAKGWRWLNVWATWCKPCVEELPRLVRWQPKLDGVDLAFVSIDEKQEDIDAFRKAHADAPASLRIADPEHINTWLAQLGLDGSPPIPIHVFVSPGGHVRCARAGSVREQDLGVVQKLLSGR